MWTGHKDKDGYGRMCHRGKDLRSHRVAYELYNGAIPKDKLIMHSCDIPGCCNPEHLSVGTNKENSDDKVTKGRNKTIYGEDRWNSKLTCDIIDEILADDSPNSQIGKKFNVKSEQIRRIKNGERWNWYTKIKK